MSGSERCHHSIIKTYLPDYLHGRMNKQQAFVVSDHMSRCHSCFQEFIDLRHQADLDSETEHLEALEARKKFRVIPRNDNP